MAAIDAHQPPSHHSQPTFERKPARPPRRRPVISHYRPVSQLLSEESDGPQTRSNKASRRNSAQIFMSLQTSSLLEMIHRSKDKGKEREGRVRKISCHASVGGEFGLCTEKERPLHPQPGATNKISSHPPDNPVNAANRDQNDNVIGRAEKVFTEKKGWHRYGGMKLHPYQSDAVYMQSYDPIMLENEKYSYLLLRRLTSPLPTFSRSMDRPPSAVLDLGCGQGHWLLDAATFWPSADFTGFDLVDVMLPEVQEKDNVRLVRGNFTKNKLPFPDKSFDFVRMAGLSLAIPHDKWSSVISEVRRVLKIGGQLELIDDELFFPYGSVPVVAPLDRVSQDSQTPSMPRHSRNPHDDRTSPGSNDSDTDGKSFTGEVNKGGPKSWTTAASHRRSTEYLQRWLNNHQISGDVEDAFTNMLRKRFVHPSPEEFVPDLLRYTFGGGSITNTQTYDIKLARPSPIQPHRNDSIGKSSEHSPLYPDANIDNPIEQRYSLGSDGHSPTRLGIPVRPSAKAAGRLGISYSDLIAATAETATRRPRTHDGISRQRPPAGGLLQSPGIIVAPSTFIPLTPIETEFHACKWIHTLLASRLALVNYVHSCVDDYGKRIVDDAELNDALWTYESFRRQRFHWPANPEHDNEGFTSPCISNTRKLDVNQDFEGVDEPVHIRTIRVYHATKTEMPSLASLLFSHNNSPPSSH
ncbi:hypothetical protein P691DRAFT_787226 [Macrolepiota fuliginosa MF-IS2]|uniref:Methyltransferase domain-containing protein n=1 Tax=Macrolepiota fuliginosa MF-IS2 TaxID=1400762 RepID=A0A9P6C7L2_9AGAR|nr:hypothetical protein P691DRAFT_787226 [Macrolepiota fuliginosa MF-IS2]